MALNFAIRHCPMMESAQEAWLLSAGALIARKLVVVYGPGNNIGGRGDK